MTGNKQSLREYILQVKDSIRTNPQKQNETELLTQLLDYYCKRRSEALARAALAFLLLPLAFEHEEHVVNLRASYINLITTCIRDDNYVALQEALNSAKFYKGLLTQRLYNIIEPYRTALPKVALPAPRDQIRPIDQIFLAQLDKYFSSRLSQPDSKFHPKSTIQRRQQEIDRLKSYIASGNVLAELAFSGQENLGKFSGFFSHHLLDILEERRYYISYVIQSRHSFDPMPRTSQSTDAIFCQSLDNYFIDKEQGVTAKKEGLKLSSIEKITLEQKEAIKRLKAYITYGDINAQLAFLRVNNMFNFDRSFSRELNNLLEERKTYLTLLKSLKADELSAIAAVKTDKRSDAVFITAINNYFQQREEKSNQASKAFNFFHPMKTIHMREKHIQRLLSYVENGDIIAQLAFLRKENLEQIFSGSVALRQILDERISYLQSIAGQHPFYVANQQSFRNS